LRRRLPIGCFIPILLIVASSAGCAGKRKADPTRQFLPAEELIALAEKEIAERDFRKARTYLERVSYSPAERPALEPTVRILLADTAFWQGDDFSLIEARSKYQDFASLYPNDPRAAYAQFQAGMAAFRQVRASSRDQGQTRTAIGDLREVLRRFPDSPYARAARSKIDEAESYLAEHEYEVGVFYLKKKKYVAAEGRLRGLLNTYPRYAEKDKVYVQLGRSLLASGNEAEGRAFLDRVLEDYPSGKWADRAQKTLEKWAEQSDSGESKRVGGADQEGEEG
jgi:outer membrane protein assembly factor BamD